MCVFLTLFLFKEINEGHLALVFPQHRIRKCGAPLLWGGGHLFFLSIFCFVKDLSPRLFVHDKKQIIPFPRSHLCKLWEGCLELLPLFWRSGFFCRQSRAHLGCCFSFKSQLVYIYSVQLLQFCILSVLQIYPLMKFSQPVLFKTFALFSASRVEFEMQMWS